MERKHSLPSGRLTTTALLAPVLAVSLGALGCALLVPPAWRASAPVPLAGSIDRNERAPTGSDTETLGSLAQSVANDRARLVEIVSDPERTPPAMGAGEQELRAIGERLPRNQRVLRARGEGPRGSRIRHPVIR